jgi:hypothetical protein
VEWRECAFGEREARLGECAALTGEIAEVDLAKQIIRATAFKAQVNGSFPHGFACVRVKKKRGRTRPSAAAKPGDQTVLANAVLWNVEYCASNFFTAGLPSMYFAAIFSICGYSSRL